MGQGNGGRDSAISKWMQVGDVIKTPGSDECVRRWVSYNGKYMDVETRATGGETCYQPMSL